LALPDTGALALPELVEQARTIVNAVDVPVIADAEAGFHDAANIWRTVQAFEQAGVAAIHIEDHEFGKHAAVEQRLSPAEETAARIRAAVEAREDPDFLIVARSDAFWTHGDLDDTIRRLTLYAEAGADMVFPTLVGPSEHGDAAIVLYYAFSALVQYEALNGAIERFKAKGTLPSAASALEDLLGYGDFVSRVEKYSR